jgi:hypothetical protein
VKKMTNELKPYDLNRCGLSGYSRNKINDEKRAKSIDAEIAQMEFRNGIDAPRPYDLGNQARRRQIIDSYKR